METFHSKVRYLEVPGDAEDDEAAAAVAAVLAFIGESGTEAGQPPTNLWGAAGRRESQGLSAGRQELSRGWREW
jgi:hypothetical protein